MDQNKNLNVNNETFCSVPAWLFEKMGALSDASFKILCTLVKYKYVEKSDEDIYSTSISRSEILAFSGCKIDDFNLALKNLVNSKLIIKNSDESYSLNSSLTDQSIKEIHVNRECNMPRFIDYDDRISDIHKQLLFCIKSRLYLFSNYCLLTDEELREFLMFYYCIYEDAPRYFNAHLAVLEKYHYIFIIPATHSKSGKREIYPLV